MLPGKPFKSIQEQIDLLRERGLEIDNDYASPFLRHINYYRFSGYALPFQINHETHRFKEGSRFKDIIKHYEFDRELRLVLLNAIERIEVSLRAHWAHHLADLHGPHAHKNPTLSKKKSWHESNLKLLNTEVNRSHELFIKHHRDNYTPPGPPIWVVCEVMSLGLLSRWLKALSSNQAQKLISGTYSINYDVLSSFIEHLTYIRNLCAHHSRVWNRNMVKTMQIPKSKPDYLISSFNTEAERKIYNTLVMLLHFVNIINPDNQIKTKLINLIHNFDIDEINMGFPEDWLNRGIFL